MFNYDRITAVMSLIFYVNIKESQTDVECIWR